MLKTTTDALQQQYQNLLEAYLSIGCKVWELDGGGISLEAVVGGNIVNNLQNNNCYFAINPEHAPDNVSSGMKELTFPYEGNHIATYAFLLDGKIIIVDEIAAKARKIFYIKDFIELVHAIGEVNGLVARG